MILLDAVFYGQDMCDKSRNIFFSNVHDLWGKTFNKPNTLNLTY